MVNTSKYDLVVIGGGPAGYAAAIRAGQLGKKVACVEMERPGGTCLNWGCIPSKALLKSAELYSKISHSEEFGISVSGLDYDFSKIIARSRSVADNMAKGIGFLFKKNKVDHFVGTAQVMVPGMVEVKDGSDKGTILSTEKTLIATGCKARTLPDLEVDGTRIMTSREALVMKKQPKSIVVVGAGAIGAEFAYFLNAFGTKVTLVEMMDQILPVEDSEVAKVVQRSFTQSGIDCRVSTKVEGITLASASTLIDPNAEVPATPDMVKLIGIDAGCPQGPSPQPARPQPDIKRLSYSYDSCACCCCRKNYSKVSCGRCFVSAEVNSCN